MTIDTLKQVDGLDVEQGITNCMDDESLFESILGMYVEQLLEYIPSLNQFFADKNWDEYGKLAHSIKGASASSGLVKVQELSKTLEQAAKEGSHEVIEQNHDAYMGLINSTLEQLKAAL